MLLARAKQRGLPSELKNKKRGWGPFIAHECPLEGETPDLHKVLRTCPPLAPHNSLYHTQGCCGCHIPIPALSSCLCLTLTPPPCSEWSVGEDRLTTCQLRPPHSPDYFDQFTHVDMVWDKELGLVQHWQLFLPFVAFDDDLGRKSRVGLVMFIVPHTLVPRSNTNPTSNG